MPLPPTASARYGPVVRPQDSHRIEPGGPARRNRRGGQRGEDGGDRGERGGVVGTDAVEQGSETAAGRGRRQQPRGQAGPSDGEGAPPTIATTSARQRPVALKEGLSAHVIQNVLNCVLDLIPPCFDLVANSGLAEFRHFVTCALPEQDETGLENKVAVKGEAMPVQRFEQVFHLFIGDVPTRG